MHTFAVLALAALTTSVSSALTLPPKRATAFFNPSTGGGSMLDDGKDSRLNTITFHPYKVIHKAGGGLGEPLNVIISGLSSPAVLTETGIVNFARAIGFSTECLGIHIGGPQSANLGDGHGFVNQTIELREDFGDANLGTCLESLIGGNHFRVYQQNGPTANSGALFLAVSKEEDASDNHNIVADGYDIGRDLLSAAAIGSTNFGGVSYSTVAENLTGLLPPGSTGVNHGIATDGITTLLTVTIV